MPLYLYSVVPTHASNITFILDEQVELPFGWKKTPERGAYVDFVRRHLVAIADDNDGHLLFTLQETKGTVEQLQSIDVDRATFVNVLRVVQDIGGTWHFP